jgi:hypothetical protein
MKLSKHFDHYTINARFMPAFFSVLPFVLTMMAWCPSAKSIMGGTLTILIGFGVMTFISSFISNLGNKRQKILFMVWGGAPTTMILRHSDLLLDKYTKQRYKKWLNMKIQGLEFPSLIEEENDPSDADQKYASAINYLREYTRNKEKYPAVYRDNVGYGFSRNLLAVRQSGFLVALFSLGINIYFLWLDFNADWATDISLILRENLLGVGSSLVATLFILVFWLVVNNDFVKERTFRYAKTLLECCEETS